MAEKSFTKIIDSNFFQPVSIGDDLMRLLEKRVEQVELLRQLQHRLPLFLGQVVAGTIEQWHGRLQNSFKNHIKSKLKVWKVSKSRMTKYYTFCSYWEEKQYKLKSCYNGYS